MKDKILLVCKANTWKDPKDSRLYTTDDFIIDNIYYGEIINDRGYYADMIYYRIFDITGNRIVSHNGFEQFGDCWFYSEEESKIRARDLKIDGIIND
jgi:hypothetical protein